MLARQRLEQGRERFVDELRERLLGGDTRAETGALLLIRRLELERSLEPELLSFIRGGSRQERALATGVMLLARLDSAESSAALLNAATHEDQRVRANAIEAIGRRVRRGSLAGLESLQEVYEPWPGDDHHRVRANALRGLLHEWPEKIEPKPIRLRDSAVEELLRMLVDERTMHRLAGVWLAERALVEPRGVGRRRSGVELALAERAHEDSDATVRDRAISGVARLDALARHGAGKRAGHLAVPIWRRPGTKDGGRA